MRNISKKISLAIIALVIALPSYAQMLNSNKLTEVGISYVQFPTEGIIMNKAYVQFVDTQEGALATLNRAFQSKMGISGGTSITSVDLSAPIFYSEGDISVIVTAREPKTKELIQYMGGKSTIVYGQGLENNASADASYAETSFKVYDGKKLIYTQEPIKLAGYKSSVASSSPGPQAGGNLTSLAAMTSSVDVADNFPHEELALQWVKEILAARYGLEKRHLDVKPYYISGLKKGNKKKAEALSEDLVQKCKYFQYNMGDDASNTELNDAITFYKSLEAQYKDDKKADVNKKNIWQIQSNIAIAYFLSENITNAKQYMEKALASKNKTIKTGESKSGKAGFSSGIAQNYLKFADKFILACDNYSKGLNANPKDFVAQFKDANSRNAINHEALNLALAYQVCANYGIELPINIYDCGGKIKKVTGTMAVEGEDYTYKYNKVWYSFFQKVFKKDLGYVTTIKSSSNPKDKVKFNEVVHYNDWKKGEYLIRPYTQNNKSFHMAQSFIVGPRAASIMVPTREYNDFVTQKPVKSVSRDLEAKPFPQNLIFKNSDDKIKINIKFNTDNDIVLVVNHERDMTGFESGKIDLAQEEVLFYDEIINVYHFNNSELDHITSNSHSVVRDRSAKLRGDAKLWKSSHEGQLLKTTISSDEKHKTDFSISASQVKIEKDGKSSTIKKNVEQNGDNWTSISIGDTKVTRTIL